MRSCCNSVYQIYILLLLFMKIWIIVRNWTEIEDLNRNIISIFVFPNSSFILNMHHRDECEGKIKNQDRKWVTNLIILGHEKHHYPYVIVQNLHSHGYNQFLASCLRTFNMRSATPICYALLLSTNSLT